MLNYTHHLLRSCDHRGSPRDHMFSFPDVKVDAQVEGSVEGPGSIWLMHLLGKGCLPPELPAGTGPLPRRSVGQGRPEGFSLPCGRGLLGEKLCL